MPNIKNVLSILILFFILPACGDGGGGGGLPPFDPLPVISAVPEITGDWNIRYIVDPNSELNSVCRITLSAANLEEQINIQEFSCIFKNTLDPTTIDIIRRDENSGCYAAEKKINIFSDREFHSKDAPEDCNVSIYENTLMEYVETSDELQGTFVVRLGLTSACTNNQVPDFTCVFRGSMQGTKLPANDGTTIQQLMDSENETFWLQAIPLLNF